MTQARTAQETALPRISHLQIASATSPIPVSATVSRSPEPPRRLHLTPEEVGRLIQTASKRGRHGQRDSTLILVTYRHGLRVGELVTLRWDQIDLKTGLLHVARLKNGLPSTHPLRGPELRALRQLRRDQQPPSPYVFTTERQSPMTTAGVRKLITRIGVEGRFPFPVHPHMLRHACGYYLASEGQDTRAIQAYLGHANITHTARYTALAPGRFKAFWRD